VPADSVPLSSFRPCPPGRPSVRTFAPTANRAQSRSNVEQQPSDCKWPWNLTALTAPSRFACPIGMQGNEASVLSVARVWSFLRCRPDRRLLHPPMRHQHRRRFPRRPLHLRPLPRLLLLLRLPSHPSPPPRLSLSQWPKRGLCLGHRMRIRPFFPHSRTHRSNRRFLV